MKPRGSKDYIIKERGPKLTGDGDIRDFIVISLIFSHKVFNLFLYQTDYYKTLVPDKIYREKYKKNVYADFSYGYTESLIHYVSFYYKQKVNIIKKQRLPQVDGQLEVSIEFLFGAC